MSRQVAIEIFEVCADWEDKGSIPAAATHCGLDVKVTRESHKLVIGGSTPSSATKYQTSFVWGSLKMGLNGIDRIWSITKACRRGCLKRPKLLVGNNTISPELSRSYVGKDGVLNMNESVFAFSAPVAQAAWTNEELSASWKDWVVEGLVVSTPPINM